MQILSLKKKALNTDDWMGAIITFAIASLWIVSLVGSFHIFVTQISWLLLVCSILIRTYLHTGLFILAHESMHGNLIPNHQHLNKIVGRLMLGIYGFLPYDRCFANHINHHRYPSQSGDPDFHGDATNPIHWYCKFMSEYFPLQSLITFIASMIVIMAILMIVFHVALINLILFWLLPLILSSLQLFFFGTYLPHRQVDNNLNFSPRLHSDRYAVLWSFLSCYNFGHYHWEHHAYPHIPWYKLPKALYRNH
ncbi:MAG: fatty acid desaturase [Pseudanabaena sp.]|jgi:beta-carotene ketolase (CrtW type)|uniref:fatty acid desaturase n=1 Tax=Pseudanabaena mucicola TaxID=71190 RepID=UPI0025756349|nr:fatty acid desaturase [Pseudanabaena mucicola]MCA6590380.1 fatty acid desaturase [Pseudanabaena sp. M109S1SP1A06QC]MCA6614501.1 fatty acid desaturase [Pseudanabaena sp. M090S1SP1A06QC]MCA6621086.1 fatty acid desaturase [Pseudanabaena sp. M165S2SP1A06QC]MCE2974950.1 fatty acid desaturase [Pseudanabaena sp. CoA8_M7]